MVPGTYHRKKQKVETEVEKRERMEADQRAPENPAHASVEEGCTKTLAFASQRCPAAGPNWAHLDRHLPPKASP